MVAVSAMRVSHATHARRGDVFIGGKEIENTTNLYKKDDERDHHGIIHLLRHHYQYSNIVSCVDCIQHFGT